MSLIISSAKRVLTARELQDNASAASSTEQERLRRWRAGQSKFTFLPPLLLAVLFLVGWYVTSAYGHINSLVLPAPADVFGSLVSGLVSGVFWDNALITIQESILGFLLATAIALPVGYGIAKSRWLAHMFQPYLAAGQAIPAVVIAPFLFLWVGTGVLPVIIICMLVVLFPLVINTILGIQTIERELIDAARLDGAAGWSLLSHIEFPLALPAILAAVRSGLTLSVTGALVGELFCSPDRGLGALVQIALHQYDMAFMFATVIVLAVLAAIYYGLSGFLVKLAEIIF